MGEGSKIEWTDHTFNPWIGCTKVSDGCTNCYAETLMDTRYGRVKWGKGNRRQKTSLANWKKPLRWDQDAFAEGVRRRVFCASLADIFDVEVPLNWRNELWCLIAGTPSLDWLILTKRPENMRDMIPPGMWNSPLLNVWFGVSAEDQKTADERIPILLETPATKRFVSAEPLLGPIDFEFHEVEVGLEKDGYGNSAIQGRIDWIIVGGESGAKARLMDPDWARSIRDQCVAADVAFFFKQWGEWAMAPQELGTLVMPKKGMPMTYSPEGSIMWRMGKKIAGRKLDGKIWSEFPKSLLEKKA